MSRGWSVGYGSRGELGTVTQPPTGTVSPLHRVGISSSRQGLSASESHKRQECLTRYAQMATQLGGGVTAAQLRALGGRHVYDQNGAPAATLSGIGVAQNVVDDGYGSLMLTSSQWGDMAGLAAGNYNDDVKALWASKPAGLKLIHNIFHEPSNNGWNTTQQLQWRQIQAQMAKAAWEHNDPEVHYSTCHIPGSVTQTWNHMAELQAIAGANTAAISKRTYIGFDPYPEVGTANDNVTPKLQTLEQKCRQAITLLRGAGQSGPLCFPEVALFNFWIKTQEPYTLTAAQQAQRIHDELWTWGQTNDLRAYFYYDVSDEDDADVRDSSRTLDTAPELLEYGHLIRGDYYTEGT